MPAPSRAAVPRWTTLVEAIAGGLLTNAAFPDAGLWPLAFLGVALLVRALRFDDARWAALVGFAWGLAFFAVHIEWAREATAVVPWLALSLMESLFVAGAGAAWVWVRRLRWVRRTAAGQALAFALVFVAVEQARTEYPFGGFPWGRLAFSQAGTPVGRAAWLGGEVAVSLLVAFVGALLGTLLVARRALPAVLACAATAVTLVAAPAVIRLPTAAQAGDLRIGAVQGNVGEPGLGAFENRGEVLGNHVRGTIALSREVPVGSLDVVLWPENGSDLDPQTARDVGAAIDRAATAVGAPILVGAQEYPAAGGRYNVLLLWEPGVGVVDRYAKQHPAPFGEYVPLRSTLRTFSDQVDRVQTDMLAGDSVALMRLPVARLGRDVPLGTVICFEVAYEPLIRAAVEAGAQVLVVPTNNASFGYTAESTQQLAMSRLRAIETGRATVQVSTVGVSGVIAPDGRVLQRTELFTADQLAATLPLRTSLTPAVRLGAWPAAVVVGSAALLLAAAVGMRLAERRRRPAAAAPGGGAPRAVSEPAASGAASEPVRADGGTVPRTDGDAVVTADGDAVATAERRASAAP